MRTLLPKRAVARAFVAFMAVRVLVLGIPAATAVPAPSGLDSTFGTAGTAVTDLGRNDDAATAVAHQGDGKTVTAGWARTAAASSRHLVVTRYLASGALDPAFGAGGRATSAVNGESDVDVTAVAIQGDGAVVAVGSATNDTDTKPFMARFTPDGDLDAAFGTAGVVIPDVTGTVLRDVAIQPDGNIVTLSDGQTAVDSHTFTLQRWTPTSGAPDLTFGVAGESTFPVCATDCAAHALAVMADGGIVVGGSSGAQMFVARLLSTGVLDPLFGTLGSVQPHAGVVRDVIVHDTFVLLAGSTGGASPDLALARIYTNGSNDLTFGTDGLAVTSAPGVDEAWQVARTAGGRIYVAGRTGSLAGTPEPLVTSFSDAGALDTDFGTDGRVAFAPVSAYAGIRGLSLDGDDAIIAGSYKHDSFTGRVSPDGVVVTRTVSNLGAGGGEEGEVVAEQADGKLIVAGFHFGDFLSLSRYSATGALDTGFGEGGVVVPDFGAAGAVPAGVVVQPDGEIVLAATVEEAGQPAKAVLSRFTPAGALDATFGVNGFVTSTPLAGGRDAAADLVVDDEGNLVLLTSRTTTAPAGAGVALFRYLVDGAPDATFGTAGSVTSDPAAGDETAVDLDQGPDGTLVASAFSEDGEDVVNSILRFAVDGAPDATFGDAGVAHDVTQHLLVAVLPDGGVMTAGEFGNEFETTKLTAAGAVDTSYGTDGYATAAVEDADEVVATSLGMQRGHPVVSGIASGLAGSTLANAGAVARFFPTGAVNPELGGDGTLTFLGRSGWSTTANHAIVDHLDRLVVTGGASSGAESDVMLARWAAPTLPATAAGYVLDHAGGLHRFGPAGSLPAAAGISYYQGGKARGVVSLPDQAGGYVLDASGALHPFKVGSGSMPAAPVTPDVYPNYDVMRAVALLPNNTGGYILDHAGGLHRFAIGTNPLPPAVKLTFYGANRARGLVMLPSGTGGYVLEANGRLHPFAIGTNPQPAVASTPDTYGTADVARGVVLLPDAKGGYIVDHAGGLHRFYTGLNPLPAPATITYYAGNTVRGLLLANGTGGYTVDNAGRLHPFKIGTSLMPAAVSTPDTWPGWDIARGAAAI